MNFKSLSKTTNQTKWRHKITFDYLIVASLMALVIILFAAQGVASAQGPPDQVVSEHALGNSPFADQLSGEEPITVTGILSILIGDDFANKRSKTNYFLKDAKTKETYKLRFSKKVPGHLRSGATVKARGRSKGRELYLALDETGQESVETILPAEMVVTGEQSTIVMLANFRDANVSCSPYEIQDLMFTDPFYSSIDDFYQETSAGNILFNGDVVGPYTINHTSTGTCETSAWAAAADAKAQADGVDLSAYTRKVYVMPKENSCGWAGLASLGGNPSRAWVFLCDSEDVFAHELGHNLGMNHAATPSYDYGDVSDIMGLSGYGLRQVNSAHREQMGWAINGNTLSITENGIYEIAPLELDGQQSIDPQVLKIAKPDTDEYYYLSYRQPIGFDTNLSSYYLGGVNVHCYKGNQSASRTYFLAKLADSESYVDSINGISITQVSHSDDYVTVQVQMDASCVTAAPVIGIAPTSQSAVAGTTLDYTITVNNTDSANCASSSFSLSPELPGGWTGNFSDISDTIITLSPGDPGTATLSVTSPAGAAPASYGFSVDVSDGTEPVHSASTGYSYVVEGINEVDTEAPTRPGGLSAGLKGKNIKLTWNAATDNVGVSGYAVWRNGAPIGDTTDTGYVDNTFPSGTNCTYTVSAYDAAGNPSAPSSAVTVTTRGDSKGGGKGKPK